MCFTWTSRVLGSVDAVCVTRAFCCEVFSVYSSFRALANCVRCWCFLVMVMVNIKAAFIIHTQRIKGPLGLYIPFESSNQVVHNYSAHLFFYAACFRAEGYDAASRRRPGGVESHLVLQHSLASLNGFGRNGLPGIFLQEFQKEFCKWYLGNVKTLKNILMCRGCWDSGFLRCYCALRCAWLCSRVKLGGLPCASSMWVLQLCGCSSTYRAATTGGSASADTSQGALTWNQTFPSDFSNVCKWQCFHLKLLVLGDFNLVND